MDAYLSRLMDDNANPEDLFDDEYYLFAGEGMSTRGHKIHALAIYFNMHIAGITLFINIAYRLGH